MSLQEGNVEQRLPKEELNPEAEIAVLATTQILLMRSSAADRELLDTIADRQKPVQRNASSDNTVKLYLEEISAYPLLQPEDEAPLARVIERGRQAASELEALCNSPVHSVDREQRLHDAISLGDEAMQAFINSNLRLVVSIANRYPPNAGMDLMDFIQEGTLGLRRGVEKFDWRKGFKFSTYATWWIRQGISRGIDNQARTIRLPGDREEALRGALRSQADAQRDGIDEPLDAEMDKLNMLSRPKSLDRRTGEESESTLADFIASPEPSTEQRLLGTYEFELAQKIIATLPPLDQEFIKERYGFYGDEDRTCAAISAKRGITPQAASIRLKRIEDRLRREVTMSDLHAD